MKWETLSLTFLKNQRAIIGNPKRTTLPKIKIEIPRRIQKVVVTSPCAIPTHTAKTNNAKTSVIMVPPTVIFTALFLEIPNLLPHGTEIRVWDENKLAKSTATKIEYPKI